MVKKNGNKDSDERTFKDGVDVTEEVKAQDGVDVTEEVKAQEELDEIERKLDLELAAEQEMNKSKADAFTFGERVKSGVKSVVSDLNFKKTKAGDSPIRNLFDDLASGQFSTKETRTFSRGVSDLKEKVAAERGGTGKPIYGLYPVSQAGKQSSRHYTKAQVMPKQSKQAQKRPVQSGSPVFRNLGKSSAGNIASTNMDFVQPLFGNPPKVAKTNRKMPNARKGNPYDLGFRV